jgi:threonine/homoserine/homoserine lactone efflux protein
MTYLSIFFTSMVVALSGAMMPGPLLTINISESMRRGAIAGPLLMAGHAVLELVLVVALLFGLSPLFKNELFFVFVAVAGGATMFWMAWGMFRSLPTLSVQASNRTLERNNNLFLAGAVMSLANPYWLVWWATIGIGYITRCQSHGLTGVGAFYSGHIIGDVLWYVAISIAISKGRSLFNDRTYRVLIGCCGAFLVAFAGYLLCSGVSKLL